MVPGVSKEEGELFAIYPNPAEKNEKITVKFKNTVLGFLNLLNASGQVISSQAVNHRSDLSFDISNLKSSVYHFQLDSVEKLPAKKLVVH